MDILVETTPCVAEILVGTRRLVPVERLMLARLLLDSVLSGKPDDEADWEGLSLAAFQRDWDNVEDAVCDNWRELYGVPAR